MSIFHKYFHGNAHNSVIFQHFFNPFFPVHSTGSCASLLVRKSFLRPVVPTGRKKEKPFPAKNGFFHPIIKPPRLNHSFYGHALFIKTSCICFSDSNDISEFSLSHLQPVLWPKTGFLSFSESIFLILCRKLGVNPPNCKFLHSFSHTTENYKEFASQIPYYSFPRQDLNPEAVWITIGSDNDWIG